MKGKKIAKIIFFVLLIGITIFIWYNSFESAAESSARSKRVTELMTGFLEKFFGAGSVTEPLVRKMAHFAEFASLGAAMMLFAIVYSRLTLQSVVNCLFASLSIAVADESIQMIFDRGSQVSDILLDFCGAASGMIIILVPTVILFIIINIFEHSKKVKKRHHERYD